MGSAMQVVVQGCPCFSRRAVLLSGCAALFGAAGWRARAATEQGLIVLIDGLPGGIETGLATDLFSRLLEEGILFGLCLPGTGDASPVLAGLIRRLFTEFPQLAEPVIRVDGLAGMSPYFQRRATSDARVQAELWLRDSLRAVTVFTADSVDGPAEFDSLRLLGVRQVIRASPTAGPAGQTMCARRVACLDQVTQIDITRDLPTPLVPPDAPLSTLVVGLHGLADLPVDLALRKADALVAALIAQTQAERSFLTSSRTALQWLDDAGRASHLAVLLDARSGAASAAPLTEALAAGGLPHSIALPDGRCPPGLAAPCRFGLSDDPAALIAQEIPLFIGPMKPGTPVFGPDAIFRLGPLPDAGSAEAGAAGVGDGPVGDGLLLLGPEAWRDAAAQGASLDRITALSRQPDMRLSSVPDWVSALDTEDPVFALFHQTRRTPTDAPPALQDGAWRDTLMQDAARAWSYFETWSERKTGLCMDTVHVTPDGIYTNGELTMWDYGSLLGALLSAHELGLIDDAAYLDWITRALANLPAVPLGGLILPCETVAVATGDAVSTDFNPCDTGRLLSLLRRVDEYPASRGMGRPVVEGWDLDGAVRKGRIQAIRNGQMADHQWSACSHYAALAFRLWGVDAASPYGFDPAESPGSADRKMQILSAAAAIGPYGAEPLLLEGLEMGFSEPSAWLATVLDVAQRTSFLTTGEPVCVSESPIDQPPWFTYQGLDLASATRRWHVATPSDAPEFRNARFLDDIRVLNAKAAFLWSALFPGAYGDLLCDTVRKTARDTDHGFNPGYYSTTRRSMTGYSDVNTNGIILQAVAHRLRKVE